MEEARSFDNTIVVLLADLDHFKQVNDVHGHPAGDEVLETVADRWLNGLRKGDFIGRYGGEEFLFVLRCCDEVRALGIADRLRDLIASEPIKTAVGEIPVTSSIGMTIWYPSSNQRIDDVVELADNALYAAKDDGRNCVRIARDSSKQVPMQHNTSELKPDETAL